MKRWYVVRTKPNCDALADSALTRQGFESFFPKVEVSDRACGQKSVPLFPGYLFIRCDIQRFDLPVVSQLPGVLNWVRFGADVPHVPDNVVADLRAQVESIHHSGGLWERFKVGQLVRVSQGKLDSLATVLEEPKSPEDRVRVLLEFMGRQVRAVVPWTSLMPEPEAAPEEPLRRGSRRTRGRGRWIRGFGPRSLAGK